MHLLSWMGAVISMALTLVLAVGAVSLSWYSASDGCQPNHCTRLRWVVATREDVSPGQQLTDRLLSEGLRHTAISIDEIAPRGEIGNQYARANGIKAGSVIERRMIGPAMWAADSSVAVVPVAVDPEFAAGVLPGMRVVFMTKVDKQSLWAGISGCGVSTKAPLLSSETPGFIVLSKSDGSDTHKAVVAVRITQKDTKSIIALSDGVWRPIVVATGAETMCIPGNNK
jgi:hypothetical protein